VTVVTDNQVSMLTRNGFFCIQPSTIRLCSVPLVSTSVAFKLLLVGTHGTFQLFQLLSQLRSARTRRFATVFTRARHRSLLSHLDSIYTPPANFPKIHSDHILTSTPWSSRWSLSFPCTHSSHLPCMPHVSPISFSLI
jgi:hypothetical protein